MKTGTQHRDRDDEQALNQVPEGEEVRIVRIVAGHPEQMIRLSGMGVVPGALVQVRQRRPAMVLALGETTLALDPEVSAGIKVRK
ncbi:MAG: ferrous iron transport protein A [Acidobacteria bacterium]|jgi:Fe2+ transport system protein FeoA|uniref:Ferrous iron transport protein A n=1 Tax=Candidatus Polarisedimenticola svalbardensis TaxID=2886004 RepID=A0A8J6Y1C3_9BACT|nr:ferrous iron transport protein A [Candidatus Polarisedimenticola svalbardensis]